jgi:hypothetical protein
MPASALATPRPQSSWVWMPSFAFFTLDKSSPVIVGDFRRGASRRWCRTHEVGSARLVGGLVAGGGVGGVFLVAVEGVLAVEDDFAAVLRPDSGSCRGSWRDFPPGWCAGFPSRGAEVLQTSVTTGVPASSRSATCGSFSTGVFARRVLPKAASFGVLEFELFGFAEELDVLFVGAGPAALDVVHAEGVEALGDAQLVGERKMDAFALRAVAERGVVEGDANLSHANSYQSPRCQADDRPSIRMWPKKSKVWSILD